MTEIYNLCISLWLTSTSGSPFCGSPQLPVPSPDSLSWLLVWQYHPAPVPSLAVALLAVVSPTPPSFAAQASAVQPENNPYRTKEMFRKTTTTTKKGIETSSYSYFINLTSFLSFSL